MQTVYKPDIRFDEIIIELEYNHIYGYKDGEAVEIVEPNGFNFVEARQYIKHKLREANGWFYTHSKIEERFQKAGVKEDD